jgi:hypothetical protein
MEVLASCNPPYRSLLWLKEVVSPWPHHQDGEGYLPFLDKDMYRSPYGFPGHKVYHKPTCTDLYLNAKSPSPIE